VTTHVLVVEDDAMLRTWLGRLLQQADYVVTQATGGADALALLRQTGEHRPPFDIVISDIVMEEVDGLAVTQFVRNQALPAEVILLTSHGALETATAAVRLGAFDYLLKPLRAPTLLACVGAAAERRAERVRLAQEAASWRLIAEAVKRAQPNAVAETAELQPQRYRDVGRLRIDTQRREISFDAQQVAVTPIEYAILVALAETPAIVVTYGTLAQRSHAVVVDEREAYGLLRTHVRNLRHKIEQRYLISVRGVGYMLDSGGDPAAPGPHADHSSLEP
jgi:DNA-binding response OmpR family regulator